MKLPPYPRYKDSGIEWLGEIPEHWEELRLSWLFRRSKITNRPDAELLSIYRDYGVIPKSSRDDNFNKPSDDLSTYQLVEVGDLVLNKMKTWQGSIAISEYEGIVSPAYFVAKPQREFNLRFVHYLLRSPIYISQYLRYSKGIRPNQWDLDFDDFRILPAILPPIEEQQAIAEYLDAETIKIDKLILKQEQLIALLREKRHALISRSVTKGLNQDIPFKDSGINWLGTIPKHWGVTTLKYASSNIVDCHHSTPHYLPDGEYPAVRTADVTPGRLHLHGAKCISADEYKERVLRLQPEQDDILYSREGERFGIAALVPAKTKLCLGQRMMLFRIKKDFVPAFFMWQLNGDSVYNQAKQDTIGATSPHVNVETIRNFRLTNPPKAEQEQIAEYIDRETAKIDALIDKARLAIEFLQEHRISIISAAVTGKIDVRQNSNGNLSNH